MPHIEGGDLCLITVGLDPEVADTARQVALQESVQFLSCHLRTTPRPSMRHWRNKYRALRALVCLIDFDKSQDLAVQTATTIQSMVNGRTALIALSGDENPDLILNAMRAGCSEYLTKPLQAEQLSSSLQKLRARWLSSAIRPAPGRRPGPCLSKRKRRSRSDHGSRSPGNFPRPAARAEGPHRGSASSPGTRSHAAGDGFAQLQLP